MQQRCCNIPQQLDDKDDKRCVHWGVRHHVERNTPCHFGSFADADGCLHVLQPSGSTSADSLQGPPPQTEKPKSSSILISAGKRRTPLDLVTPAANGRLWSGSRCETSAVLSHRGEARRSAQTVTSPQEAGSGPHRSAPCGRLLTGASTADTSSTFSWVSNTQVPIYLRLQILTCCRDRGGETKKHPFTRQDVIKTESLSNLM